MNWHQLSIAETFELLKTNKQGLNEISAGEKLLQVGPNELQEGKKKSIAGMLQRCLIRCTTISRWFEITRLPPTNK